MCCAVLVCPPTPPPLVAPAATRTHTRAQVTAADFMRALEETKPAFGAATESLESYRTHGILDCGTAHGHLLATLRTLVGQVQNSAKTPLLTCLLEGPAGEEGPGMGYKGISRGRAGAEQRKGTASRCSRACRRGRSLLKGLAGERGFWGNMR
jgi:hypothetical protein